MEFLSGRSEMDRLIRAADWSRSGLGAPDNWPNSLKTIVRVMLDSRYAIWIGWGPELTFLYNDAYREMTLGRKHPWALGQPAREVWAEAWEELAPRVEEVVRRRQATYDEDLQLLLERSGFPEETYHTFSYSPLPNDDGGFGGLLCIVVEDTARYLAERRLTTLRELAAGIAEVRTETALWAAVEQVLAGNRQDLPFTLVYLVEKDGVELRLAGRTGFEGESSGAPAIIQTGAHPELWPISAVLAKGETQVLRELPEVAGGWSRAPWGVSPKMAMIMPIMHPGQSAPAGVLIAGLNVYRPLDGAYRSFIEMMTRQLAAGLGDVRAYANERERAERLAQIDRAKTVFLSNTSHEFRTPLSLMLGPIEEALSSTRGESSVVLAREELELAYRNGHRLMRLVNGLLDFSRIEAGRLRATYEAVDIAEFTVDVTSTFGSAMEKAGLSYTISCEPPSITAYVDRGMWEQIVLNLVSNAFKFTLRGEIEVALRATPASDAVELMVRDTGAGIPAAELPRIFERFHRVEGQAARTAEGTGIGLALVQELVRLHGGEITVESVEGQGATFTVSLPLGVAHLPAEQVMIGVAARPRQVSAQDFVDEALRWLPAEAAPEPALESGEQAWPGFAKDVAGARILVADDNADLRDYLTRLLSANYEVEAANDGAAALEAARRNPPELILSDVMMPRLDGFGLLRELRADPQLRETPVVLLSARAGEEASVEGLAQGADDYLIKPFTARELLARVATNLNFARRQRRAEEELRRINQSLEELVASEVADRMKAEEAFRQAQRMEVVGQLTGGVAHDFNNLLQVISGNLEALRQRLGSGDTSLASAQPLLEAAMRGANRGASLTQRLLAFSRRQPLRPEPVDVNRLVSGMTDMLRRTLGETIVIETRMSEQPCVTLADPNELENALLNLAINARDAMPDGGKLTIGIANTAVESSRVHENEPSAGEYVTISVTDNGQGMSREVAEKAFEPFFTTKEVGQGTGLGLSQVYGFVRQSGGYVQIETALSRGTTVKIHMPRMQLQGVGEADASAAESVASKVAPTRRILVVEDDPDVRELTVTILRDLGYAVMEAGDGVSAIGLLERGARVDLILTDVGLPGGMDGRKLAAQVRQRRPGQKVLFITGYERSTVVHSGRLDPGIELLAKPFTLTQLASKIREVLNN